MKKKICLGMAAAACIACIAGCGNITVKVGQDHGSTKPVLSEETETGQKEASEDAAEGTETQQEEMRQDAKGTEAETGSEAEKPRERSISAILAMDPEEWNAVEIVNGNIPDFEAEHLIPEGPFREWKEYETDEDAAAPASRVGDKESPRSGSPLVTSMTAVVHTLYPKAEYPCPGRIRPSGYHNVYYRIIQKKNGEYGTRLMRKCHLLKPVLGGSCEDENNFFAGTYALNYRPGMAKYEHMIMNYLKETDGYVLYRVRPRFIGNNALASGVEMEGYSLDDNGKSVCFHVFIRNIQDGIAINYETGTSYLIREGLDLETGEDAGDETETDLDMGEDLDIDEDTETEE